MRNKICLIFLVVLMTLSKALSLNKTEDRFTIVMNRLVMSINSGDYKSIQKDFGKEMLDVFPVEKSKPFFEKLISENGKIKKIDSAKIILPSKAIFPINFEKAIFDFKIILDNQDKIVGLWVLPHSPNIPAPEKNSVSLQLPFDGKWLTFWGGNTIELNQHYNIPFQKFAFDFVIVNDSGKTYSGDGTDCEDYFAFGKNVLSPANGVVVNVITGVHDNTPFSMNPYSALGNCIIIQHDKNEYSVIAHIKNGSVLVKPGDKENAGQIIGLCGNSGNSSEPHIHYHLQNTSIIQDGIGIPCSFDKILLWKQNKSDVKVNYSPLKGDILSNFEK